MAEDLYRPWLWKVPEGGVIGKHVRLKNGQEKASGKGIYSRDVYRPGMLYAKFIRSPYIRAKVKNVDATEAKALRGVWDVITYNDEAFDLKWFNLGAFAGPPPESDELIITKKGIDVDGQLLDAYTEPDRANWHGQPVGVIVVAENEQICDEALRLVKIEWEELPWIIDPQEALKPDARVLFPEMSPDNNLRREVIHIYGDVEKGFREADRVVEFRADHGELGWGGIEAAVAVAEYKGEKLDVWFRGQDPKRDSQEALERYVKRNQVNAHIPLQGGSFGNICQIGVPRTMVMIAAIAAKKTGRPVKVLYDQSHFHGFEEGLGYYYYKVGFKQNGRITAVQIHYIGTCMMGSLVDKLRSATNIPNIKCIETVPYHNRGPAGPHRAGGMECSVVTSVFEHVTGELGIDPTKVAVINDGCEGHDMAWVNENVKKVQGFDPTRDSLKEVLEKGKKAIDWDNKWHLPGTKLLPNGNYHGMGVVWLEAWSHYHYRALKMGLVISHDGTIGILARGVETGTHRVTTYPQIVADEVGMRFEDVYWKNYDDMGFDASLIGSSAGLQWNVPVLVRAARKMKQQILEYAVSPTQQAAGALYPDKKPVDGTLFPGKKPEELDIKNSEIFEKAYPKNRKPVVELAKLFDDQVFVWDFGKFVDEKKYIMGRQAYFVEVEVNPETGETLIKKVVIARDCGKVINPDSCDQQLYGVYQGLGRANTEVIYRDPRTGVRLNTNLIDYPQLTMNDIESIGIEKIETGLGYGPYGLIGIGESAGCSPCAITGPAIHNAIGKYIDSYPTTPDKVLKALGKA
jgi:CO/xanthine dehydrogenase Mo-binding subunit